MASLSNNITQRIVSGGIINVSRSTSGTTNILTTLANEYAQVFITSLTGGGFSFGGSGSGSASLFVGGIGILSASGTQATGSLSLQQAPSGAANILSAIPFIYVPPSTTLSLQVSIGVSGSGNVQGSFVIFGNTP